MIRHSLLILAAVSCLLLHSAGSELVCRPHSNCRLLYKQYVPSHMEIEWAQNISVWQNDYCKFLLPYLPELKKLVAAVQTEPQIVDWGAERLLSKFHYSWQCGSTIHNYASRIEPLVAALRNPTSLCVDPETNKAGDLLSRDYLVLEHQYSTESRAQRIDLGLQTQKFLFDLGASTYNQGPGGASQKYFVESYKKLGVTFDRMLLWEAGPIAPEKLFAEVPDELFAAYQYFNVPVSPDLDNPRHPLSIIKTITTPLDFVVLKLDVDTPMIENPIIRRILADPQLYVRIDEIMFEHHVDFGPMHGAWKKTIDPNATLADSYRLFSKLRRRGIRMHGWP